ncbi:MAG: hypothetical protein KDA87_20490 [Planctomycetales bacterium]|nr:hypothetical protein [Planctomycetales bacterium]
MTAVSLFLFPLKSDADMVANGWDYSVTSAGSIPLTDSQDSSSAIDNTVASLPIGTNSLRFIADGNQSSVSTHELKAMAQLIANISVSDGTSFSVDARAYSESTITDSVEVTNFPGTVTGGELIFAWALDGNSSISASVPSGMTGLGVTLNNLASTVQLTSSVSMTPIADETIDVPSAPFSLAAGSSFSDSFSATTGTTIIPVPFGWTAGEFNVDFTLVSEVHLNATNNGASGLSADLLADYYNTATLIGVIIKDQNGNVLPDAVLTGTNFTYNTITAVPEPSAFWFGALVVLGGAVWQRLRKSRSHQ